MKFRLEKVLRHRQTLEVVAQQELAAAEQREAALDQEMTALREGLAACYEDFEAAKRQGMTPQELQLYQGHLQRQGEGLLELAARLEAARLEVESRREALVVATTNKRLLEKLKDKKIEEFRLEELSRENRDLDEIAIQQFIKR